MNISATYIILTLTRFCIDPSMWRRSLTAQNVSHAQLGNPWDHRYLAYLERQGAGGVPIPSILMIVSEVLRKETDEEKRTWKWLFNDPKISAIGNTEFYPIWTYFYTSNKFTYGCMMDVVCLSKYHEMMIWNISRKSLTSLPPPPADTIILQMFPLLLPTKMVAISWGCQTPVRTLPPMM